MRSNRQCTRAHPLGRLQLPCVRIAPPQIAGVALPTADQDSLQRARGGTESSRESTGSGAGIGGERGVVVRPRLPHERLVAGHRSDTAKVEDLAA